MSCCRPKNPNPSHSVSEDISQGEAPSSASESFCQNRDRQSRLRGLSPTQAWLSFASQSTQSLHSRAQDSSLNEGSAASYADKQSSMRSYTCLHEALVDWFCILQMKGSRATPWGRPVSTGELTKASVAHLAWPHQHLHSSVMPISAGAQRYTQMPTYLPTMICS